MPPEPVRVMRIIARLNIGGPAIHATLLSEHLDPLGYETVLVAGTEEAGEGSYLELRGARVRDLRRIPELGREIRGLRDVSALLQLTRLIRAVRPQIVHTHTAKAGTLGRLAAWLCGVPIIVHTYHGHVFHGYFSPVKTRVFVAIERWLGRRSHRLVTVTPTVRREVLDLGIGRADRFDIVPLGFELSSFLGAERMRGRLRAELGIDAAAPIVGIVARLAPIKAHERFLAVAARVAGAMPEATFLIVGDGERRAELEALAAQLGLASQTRFLGWRGDLDAVYADLDVVALTSKNEGSPVALIEAMAAARPVVAMRVGGVADVVAHGRTGCVVEPGDEAGMAAAIIDLLNNPDRAVRLGEAARAHVVETYGAERLVRDIDTLYRQLLAGRAPRVMRPAASTEKAAERQ
jgi:glycosyltransferase involved in cell wall biosynthesis